MEKEILKLATKESQLQLLQQVLAASDADAEEEDIKEETVDGSRETKVSRYLIYSFYEFVLANTEKMFRNAIG